ncbi:hypothetical protein, partial [Streptomyces heilongjiangensis]|uniref:KS-MAT linker domain-containing protein n=1 Tax=Streptomyces heilongjiangensis TaxID=945052 RepID=UPI003A8D1AC4
MSGHTEPALRAQAARLTAHVTGRHDVAADVVGRTLAVSRAGLEHRAVVVGTDREDLLRGIAAVADDRPDARVVRGRA